MVDGGVVVVVGCGWRGFCSGSGGRPGPSPHESGAGSGGKVHLSASPPFFVRPLRLLKEALCFFSFLFISLDSALCESPQARQARKGGYIHPPSLLV
jgi:hypothetical protein